MVSDFRERVGLHAKSIARSSVGDATPVYRHACTLWAKVEPLSGGEVENAGKMQSVSTYRFTFRRWQGIERTMRLTWNAMTFDIVDVVDPGPGSGKVYVTAKVVNAVV